MLSSHFYLDVSTTDPFSGAYIVAMDLSSSCQRVQQTHTCLNLDKDKEQNGLGRIIDVYLKEIIVQYKMNDHLTLSLLVSILRRNFDSIISFLRTIL
ncbi:hypothetical protein NQ317_015552 [Molorchus minor]|uniref:Uncharacterized protein n=1 Tax=Molorchus minor TaxID=1323400 RepID=A0ABQ9JE97_9CUCU|nr:hypothetical protein NQ317_015552 [Molorchus minor]